MKLIEYLNVNNFSYADFGRMMQVSAQAVRKWALLNVKPHKRYARKIAKKTNGDVDLKDLGW